ncbi:MAG: cytochrome C, partial [Pseudomonadota bacterium]
MRHLLFLGLALCSPAAAQDFFTLKGHGGPIMDVAVSPSGQIATASFDNAVGLWADTVPQWFDGHAAAVTAVSFLNEDTVVSGGDDFTLRLWSEGQGEIMGRHQAKIMSGSPSAKARSWHPNWPWPDGFDRGMAR